jgi:hypothetical protein
MLPRNGKEETGGADANSWLLRISDQFIRNRPNLQDRRRLDTGVDTERAVQRIWRRAAAQSLTGWRPIGPERSLSWRPVLPVHSLNRSSAERIAQRY